MSRTLCLRLGKLRSSLPIEVSCSASGLTRPEALCRVVTEQCHTGARQLLHDSCNVDNGLVVHDAYFRRRLPQAVIEKNLELNRALGIRMAHH